MGKEQYQKITLEALIAKKEQSKLAKAGRKTITLFVQSLGGTIVVQQPDISTTQDALKMDDDGDAYLVYQCCIDPLLKDAQLREDGDDPFGLVYSLFLPGEITAIASECLKLAGYDPAAVNVVEAVKN